MYRKVNETLLSKGAAVLKALVEFILTTIGRKDFFTSSDLLFKRCSRIESISRIYPDDLREEGSLYVHQHPFQMEQP